MTCRFFIVCLFATLYSTINTDCQYIAIFLHIEIIRIYVSRLLNIAIIIYSHLLNK